MMRQTHRTFATLIVCSAMLAALLSAARADAPRAYEEGKLPDDHRLGKLRTLDDYFPFEPVGSPELWRKRREQVRRRVLVANGLWPMPSRQPTHTVVHGELDMGDYTISKVYFESYPGHYVTGSLYRPAGASLKFGVVNGKRPGILSPHGHWSNGRFYDAGEAGVKKQIEQGAEKFEIGGRSPLQARCVQLARMGCIVLHYDMEGYADSVQFAHRPGVRPHMFKDAEPKGQWGFFSPQAELRLQSFMGLQTWNSIRALDVLLELDGVDAARIGCTGASGGGTQTMILSAIDPRIAVSVPAVMVSTAMQGGCTCENADYLRIGTGNVEFAALFAPKPLCLLAADDWTKELMTKGYPQLQQLYRTLGAPGNVFAVARTQFKHNYNHLNRQTACSWFNKHFKLGVKEPIEQHDYKRLTAKELTVWDDKHPKPKGGDAHERELIQWMTKDSDKRIAEVTAKGNDAYRKLIGGALDVMLDHRALTDGASIEWNLRFKKDVGGYLAFSGVLRDSKRNEELPAAFFHPKQWNKQVVVWVDPQGKSTMFTNPTTPAPPVQKLIDAGYAVAAADLFLTGEFTADGRPAKSVTLGSYRGGKSPWQKFCGYTFGYNHATFARRVHDVLTLTSFVRNYQNHPAKQVHLLGMNGAGKWVAAAVAQMNYHGDRDKIGRVAIDTAGFRFEKLDRFDHPDFLPGIVKYGDVPALLALCAPQPLLVTGERATAVVTKAYRNAGAPKGITFSRGNGQATDDVIDWLIAQ